MSSRLYWCHLILLVFVAAACLAVVTRQDIEAVDFKAKKTKGDTSSWQGHGKKFISLGDKKAWIKWNVNVPTAGQHVLTFRHANLVEVEMEIVLNGSAETSLSFNPTPWGQPWDETSTTAIPLEAGMNTIVLSPSQGGSGTDVDMVMTVEFNGDKKDSGDDGETVLYDFDSNDHAQLIQNALNSLDPNETLHLIGDFTLFRTIYFPSDFTWRLDGTLRLGNNATLDLVGWRLAAIAAQPGGATNIQMTGGYYNGNRRENAPDVRLINFLSVTNSVFRDMTIESAGDDNFSLGKGSQYNQVQNLISRYAGGNGLTDKGSYNKWYDCVAEFCDSDGWTPKSQYSEYHRCVARENDGPGFGLYARTDQPDINLGAKLNVNSFIEVEAYCNKRSGMSFNIALNCGPGAELKDNLVKGFFYKNGRSGVEFTNMLADGQIINNSMDIVAIDNFGWSSTTLLGGVSVKVAGQAVPFTSGVADQIYGHFVGYGNNQSNKTDVNIMQTTNSEIMVYETDPMPEVLGNVKRQPSSIVCPAQATDEWRVRKYCEMKASPYKCVTKWK